MPGRLAASFFLPLALMLVACGGGGAGKLAIALSPTPASTPELTVEERYKRDIADLAASRLPRPAGVDALYPEVREAVQRQAWARDGFDANERLLLEFLHEGTQNLFGLGMDWPYVTKLEGGRLTNSTFDAAREVRIVENGLFEFLPLQKGTIVVVFSSEIDVSRREVEPIIAALKRDLPRLEQFIGHPYRTSYLHIQLALGDYPDLSLERGSNVFLGWQGKFDAGLEFILVHEIAHSFMSMLPWDARPWLREGMADLIAAALTGVRETSYTRAATYTPLITGSDTGQPGTFSRFYAEESGNGSVFLLEVLELIGLEAMSKVVQGIHDESQSRQRRQADILALMRRHAPEGKQPALEAVIEKWTRGTGLVKPRRAIESDRAR